MDNFSVAPTSERVQATKVTSTSQIKHVPWPSKLLQQRFQQEPSIPTRLLLQQPIMSLAGTSWIPGDCDVVESSSHMNGRKTITPSGG
ncbi:hypothetical protein TNCV_2255091 [Trichonephila clavipes]|nr:hypothetical protein TNCV_2255091 [Trichonephila clavipes]